MHIIHIYLLPWSFELWPRMKWWWARCFLCKLTGLAGLWHLLELGIVSWPPAFIFTIPEWGSVARYSVHPSYWWMVPVHCPHLGPVVTISSTWARKWSVWLSLWISLQLTGKAYNCLMWKLSTVFGLSFTAVGSGRSDSPSALSWQVASLLNSVVMGSQEESASLHSNSCHWWYCFAGTQTCGSGWWSLRKVNFWPYK